MPSRPSTSPLVGSLLAFAALSVPLAAHATEALAPPDYSHIYQTTLPNGLDVVVVEAPSLPIVTIELAVRNGAFTEPPEWNGLSHLYEHMFFKANAVLPSQEAYMAEQRRLGMVWNGTTGTERVNYFFTLQSHNLLPGLEFMLAAIRTPLFREDELVREREVVIGEFDRNEADPGYHLGHAVDSLLWFEHPTRKDPLGDRATILSATVEQMREMQSIYYVPNNSLLVLAGDVSADDGFALAAEVFGDWEVGAEPETIRPIPEHPPLQAHAARVVAQPIQVSVVTLAWQGPDTRRDVEATYAADVFSFALDQPGTGFQQRVVDTGLALQAGLSYSTQRYTGQVQLTAITLPGREDALLRALLAELDRFDDDDYLTDEQIATAQTQLAVSDLYTQQSTTDLAHTLSYWWASASIEYYLGYIGALARVERADMQAFVQDYLLGHPMALVAMASEENLAASGINEAWLLSHAEGSAE